jgi:hypothetical protein
VYEDWNKEDPPLSQAHFAQLTHYNEDQLSYEKAMKGPDALLWKVDMQDEYNSLIERKIWTLVPKPQDAKIFDPKWVL